MSESQHPTPDAGAEKPVGPILKAGVGEQPPFATERIAMADDDVAALWKRRITRIAALALALLILWGLWRWFDAAREQREPCANSGFPVGCEEPPGVWRQVQFVVALAGMPVGLLTAALVGLGAALGRRSSRLPSMALTYLGLLVAWIAMHWIGRWVW